MKSATAEATTLLDRVEEPTTDLAPAPTVSMFERLAMDPNVPVDKLEKLIELQERIMAHNAKAEFDAAYAQMQGEIPIITERGEILVNGQLRSKYARLEDILEAVRPILQQHGFAIRHRSEFVGDLIKTIGILSHRSGHSEQDEFVAAADTSGGKNAIQSLGSTRAYGQRYTTIALLGIATRGQDDDGHGSERGGKPDAPAPKGFDDWLVELEAVADNGTDALRKAWEASKAEYRNHLTKTNKGAIGKLKARAAAVQS